MRRIEGPKRKMLDVNWIEDFLAAAECGTFSRAAQRRNVTQPAFSRRVRALEEWLGADLLERTPRKNILTSAGEQFFPVAEMVIRDLQAGRTAAREAGRNVFGVIQFLCPHGLSVGFFPRWIQRVQRQASFAVNIGVVTGVTRDIERLLLARQAQFLLCYYHPSSTSAIDSKDFQSLRLASEVVLPVSAPLNGGPRYKLPGTAESPLPYLAFTTDPGHYGRISAALQATPMPRCWLMPAATSQSTVVLSSLARDGAGIAWVPRSLVADDLCSGRLVRAGEAAWDVEVELRLYRPRTDLDSASEAFWSLVCRSDYSPLLPGV